MTCVVMFPKNVLDGVRWNYGNTPKHYHGNDLKLLFPHPDNGSFIFAHGKRIFLYDPKYSENPKRAASASYEMLLCMEVADFSYKEL